MSTRFKKVTAADLKVGDALPNDHLNTSHLYLWVVTKIDIDGTKVTYTIRDGGYAITAFDADGKTTYSLGAQTNSEPVEYEVNVKAETVEYVLRSTVNA